MEAMNGTADLSAAPILPRESQDLRVFATGAAPEAKGDLLPQDTKPYREPGLVAENATGHVTMVPALLKTNGIMADAGNAVGNGSFTSTPVPLTNGHQEGPVTEPTNIELLDDIIELLDDIWSPATKLKRRLEDTKELIVCPGVYDGFSARIAMSVGFDAMYMVLSRFFCVFKMVFEITGSRD